MAKAIISSVKEKLQITRKQQFPLLFAGYFIAV